MEDSETYTMFIYYMVEVRWNIVEYSLYFIRFHWNVREHTEKYF